MDVDSLFSAATAGGADKGFLGNWDNEFFRGGLGLAVLGACASLARRSFTGGSALLRKYFSVSLEVTRLVEEA